MAQVVVGSYPNLTYNVQCATDETLVQQAAGTSLHTADSFGYNCGDSCPFLCYLQYPGNTGAQETERLPIIFARRLHMRMSRSSFDSGRFSGPCFHSSRTPLPSAFAVWCSCAPLPTIRLTALVPDQRKTSQHFACSQPYSLGP